MSFVEKKAKTIGVVFVFRTGGGRLSKATPSSCSLFLGEEILHK
jgi:hypothetical protein